MKYDDELAELVGWRFEERKFGEGGKLLNWWNPEGIHQLPPNFKASMDAMLKWVYPVLRERGLWQKFFESWEEVWEQTPEGSADEIGWTLTVLGFLHDLPGQYKAAVAVLKEANGE